VVLPALASRGGEIPSIFNLYGMNGGLISMPSMPPRSAISLQSMDIRTSNDTTFKSRELLDGSEGSVSSTNSGGSVDVADDQLVVIGAIYDGEPVFSAPDPAPIASRATRGQTQATQVCCLLHHPLILVTK
jgi:hypothetical protein